MLEPRLSVWSIRPLRLSNWSLRVFQSPMKSKDVDPFGSFGVDARVKPSESFHQTLELLHIWLITCINLQSNVKLKPPPPAPSPLEVLQPSMG